MAYTGVVLEGARTIEQPSIPGLRIWPLIVEDPEVTILEIPPVVSY